jgi:type IV fimbrial biogenesis protein FimT
LDRLARGHCRRRLAAGFTLPELLIVIAVAAILAVIAIPSLVNTVQTNRVDAAANQFVATLSMARSEAVKLGCTVNVTSGPSLPIGNWGNGGWTVSVPPTCSPTKATATLQNIAPLTGQMTAYGTLQSVSFNSTGQSVDAGTGAVVPEVDFIFCADGSTPTYPLAQGVTVIASGRVRLADHPSGAVPAGAVYRNNETTQMLCTSP